MRNQVSDPEAPDYELEAQIGFVLRLAVQFHTSIFTSRMVDGLTQTQFATLAKVRKVGPCSQSDLAKFLALDTATVNGVVDRMSSRGLLVSADDPNDRRRQTVSLTRKGAAVVKAAIAAGREITTDTLLKLTQAEERRLVQLLRKMIGEPAKVLASAGEPIAAAGNPPSKAAKRVAAPPVSRGA